MTKNEQRKTQGLKHRFQPGNNANPKGAGAHFSMKRETRKYTAQLVAEIYNKLSELNRKQLRSLIINEDSPALEVIIAKCLLRDCRNADQTNTEKILSRIIGNIPIKSEFSGSGGAPLTPPTIIIQEVEAPKGLENADPSNTAS